jgi:hypothetical protein
VESSPAWCSKVKKRIALFCLLALLLLALPLISACGGDEEEVGAPTGEAKQHYNKGIEYG